MSLQPMLDIADTALTLLPFVAMGAVAAYLTVHFHLIRWIGHR